MMERLYLFDIGVLLRLQAFAHKAQRTVGLKASTLAYLCCIVSAGFAIWHSDWILTFLSCTQLGALLILRLQGRPTDILHWNQFGGFARLMLFGSAIFGLPFDIPRQEFWVEFFLLAAYFQDCIDLPEDKSKLREWLESFSMIPEPLPSVG